MRKSVLFLCLGLGLLTLRTNTWADECKPESYPDYGFGANEEVFAMVNGALIPIFFRSAKTGGVFGCRAEASLLHPIAIPKSFFPVEIATCSNSENGNDWDCQRGNKFTITPSGCYLIGSRMDGVDPITHYKLTQGPLDCKTVLKSPTKSIPQKSKEPAQKGMGSIETDKKSTKN